VFTFVASLSVPVLCQGTSTFCRDLAAHDETFARQNLHHIEQTILRKLARARTDTTAPSASAAPARHRGAAAGFSDVANSLSSI
jgi:hypothetical protein